MNLLLALLCCNTCGLMKNELNDNNSSPKVLIVGAGAAGIAAATRLLINGFTNITILEAESRIGGRVHSIKIGDYMVDMGGQWVHGEKNNVVFELAWPLGLIERMSGNFNVEIQYFGSSGVVLSSDIANGLSDFQKLVETNITHIGNLNSGSFGEYATSRYLEYFKSHPDISRELYEPLLYSLNLAKMTADGADNLYHVSAKGLRDYSECEGDQNNNWKNRTYSTILDILMKKFPNPEEELPVLENTYKNSKVTKINYNENSNAVKVLTADGAEYLADHVIFTPSLGVLKENYEQLFDPPLPERKVKAIENFGFGHVAKIWLYYENPWWNNTDNNFIVHPILWTLDEWNAISSYEPEKLWMLGVFGVISVEHKPKLLCIWLTSDASMEVELVPEEMFRNQVMELLNKFYSHTYNVSEPTKIERTTWNNNENFLGTYSYHSTEADRANISYVDLAEPIMQNDKPILQFAGEATSEHYSTVHGAIDSGWREADRIINLYSNKKELSPILKQFTENSVINLQSLINKNIKKCILNSH